MARSAGWRTTVLNALALAGGSRRVHKAGYKETGS